MSRPLSQIPTQKSEAECEHEKRSAASQVTWIGYPNSTGLRAVDYRLTDAACDPLDTHQVCDLYQYYSMMIVVIFVIIIVV